MLIEASVELPVAFIPVPWFEWIEIVSLVPPSASRRIALSLLSEPKVLLLDECFAALDVLTIKMLQEIIVNLQNENQITICICDHQARDLLACVDVAMILSNGKIVAQNTPSNLVKDINAKNAYFGDSFKFN